tara:strand:- start:11891 stop:12229 length:339 start_codon:yes stop_codon:yes gene_type:complete
MGERGLIRIAFQIALVLIPFLLFAIYRIATRNRREPGEPWPIVILVVTGLALSLFFYIYLFFKDPRGERTCSTDPVFVNGEIIPAREVPCEAASIDSRKHDVKPQEIGPDGR